MTNKVVNSSFSARHQALNWLNMVVRDGRSVNDILANSNSSDNLSSSQISFAKQQLFGSLRFYHQIKAILDQLLEKPLKQKDLDVYSILVLGIYQLRYMSVPDHAAISESVELTRQIKKPWASRLVNGCLRSYQRQVKEIEQKLAKAQTFKTSHPNWIINQIEADWGDKAQTILEANNQQAPMTIRVNQQRVSRTDYQQMLQSEGMESTAHPLAKDGLVMHSACDVFKLPKFEQGWVTVQDAAAQLVVDLMSLEPNMVVLDGCAAPGGKTTHILQREPSTRLTSVEKSESRLKRIEQTLERLNMECQLTCADIIEHQTWWNGELFDRILIDVPCSASGVIRRNPDIKLHRKKLDLTNIVELQAKILAQTWKLLKPGGRLVYATCSIFKDENEKQIEHFVKKHDAKLIRLEQVIDSKLHRHSEIGHQIFPGDFQMDGFYLCCLEKPL